MSFNHQRRTDHRFLAAVGRLPGVMTEHDDGRRRRRVVVSREQAAAEGTDTERREVVARNVFGSQRTCRGVDPRAANAQCRAARLKGRQLIELGRLSLQPLEQRKREQAPAALRAAIDAAVIAVADAIEALRIRHGQRPQHDGVDEGKDRGRAANAQRQRQNGRGGKDWRTAGTGGSRNGLRQEGFPCASVRRETAAVRWRGVPTFEMRE